MRLGHESPVNKTARIVTSKGFKYKPDKKIQNLESGIFLETKEIPITEKNQSCFEDLTGLTVGRLCVVGRYAFGQGWVVRCSCGTYAIRRKKSILNKLNTQDRCEECRHLAHLKREDVFRRTGKRVDIKEF